MARVYNKKRKFQQENLHPRLRKGKIILRLEGFYRLSLWDTYSSFANCYGGVIILGIRENKDRQLHPTAAGLLMFGNEYDIVRQFPDYFLDYRAELDPNNRWTDRIQSSSGDWSGNIYQSAIRENAIHRAEIFHTLFT